MENHNKVIFHKLQPTYYQDSDIPVTYSLGSEVSPVSSDRVGLYRVGFTTIQDYIDYLWAPVPTGVRSGLPQTVVFKSTSFKKENAGDFFQFCYVTHGGHIVGVSAPFQLLRVGGSSEVEGVEEEEEEEAGGGMVVVRSKESVLQEKLLRVSEEREQLQSRVEEVDERRVEAEKKVEEQTQQLSLCQHHLQALEVKLKRETSEKCELMGRVGQVVEERGHLEERLKVAEKALAGVQGKNTTLEEALKKSEARVALLQEAALVSRKAGEEGRLKREALEEELKELRDTLQSTKGDLQKAQEERDKALKDIELWTSTAESDSQEKNSLALKYTVATEELLGKEEELEETRRKNYGLEERLERTLEELTAVKTTHSALSEEVEGLKAEREIHLEREAIVKGDMANLKERLATLEDDQKRERGGREAAENIACDLSSRLQAARAEYQRLATINHRLLKKLKRARSQQASVSESSDGISEQQKPDDKKDKMATSTNSWVCAEAEEEEEEEEVEEEEGGGVDVPRSMTQSTLTTTTTRSCCSHSTQQLSEVVNQKMEDIVRELSQQIMSLKLQLQEKERIERVEEHAEEEEKGGGTCGASVEAAEPTENPGADPEVEQPTSGSSGGVLYGKSFLPTAPTAPVFLPERPTPPQRPENPQATPTTPTAPHTHTRTEKTTHTPTGAHTDPTPPPRTHYYITPQRTPTLPPPLTPESTPTARQAAVLSQFTTQPNPPTATQHESDDDDFHSTDSDTDNTPPPSATSAVPTNPISAQPQQIPQPPQQEQQQQHPQLRRVSPGTPNTGPLLDCPMCSLCFPLGAARLLNEHIESHLAHVCPVCSIAFQRNCRDKFEEHVQSHFEEEGEEVEPPAGNSGPWGEIRTPHLLEFD